MDAFSNKTEKFGVFIKRLSFLKKHKYNVASLAAKNNHLNIIFTIKKGKSSKILDKIWLPYIFYFS